MGHQKKRLISVRNVNSKVDSQNPISYEKKLDDYTATLRMSPDTPSQKPFSQDIDHNLMPVLKNRK